MKNILVIYYSQSGQLTEILNNITSAFNQKEITIDYHKIEMEQPFPFPWTKNQFFNVFPETFKQIPSKVKPVSQDILDKEYDLVILGYPIWYLTPALPTTSFLSTTDADKLLKNKPVITVIGCRNMWIMAQEKLKKKLVELNAKLVGNIVLADRHINHISVITIVDWMFTGVKRKKFGIFPKPGVSQKDIDEAVKFGPIIEKHVLQNDYNNLQNNLLEKEAVKIKPFLIIADKRGNLIFSKWADLIKAKGEKSITSRNFWLIFFKYYLLFAIWIIAPIVFILFLLTYVFSIHKIKKDKEYYSSVKNTY
ncbi:dialkylrecorsinol condensing enzyme DarA [uncultured Lacinutrix sp.]|uniref:flavodoxin family protein n=1 Tax=uncultured Lacinutrix sp. TaxID=574032 RepID=UPI00261BE8C4|nr:dialkylrecorsinol condensing enzyme DarA [uncultured Lacinutrix sp.]